MAEQYQWKVQEEASDEFVGRFPELTPIVVQLLANRGIETQEEVDRFLTPDYGQDQHDPYLFRDMEKVVERIGQAVDKKEKVVIHGDYDADGVCGSALMHKTLTAIGCKVDVYLPHRDTEGYGLNMNTVQSLADVGTNLLITVDCGISNKEEVEKAVELGMDVIITDHHTEPPELPQNVVGILNAKLEAETYPFKYFAGVGVAFKLAQALIKKYELGEAFEKWLLDLVAISTVTDHVELTGENRIFLKYGLIVLQKNQRLGLQKLFEVMGVEAKTADTTTIGFKLGPHINAAGRIDHANMAFEMLIEEDEAKAVKFAEDLSKTNKERQKISRQLAKEALVQAEKQKDEFVIIIDGDEWPVGLVGLVAGKVSSEFNRPTFIISKMGEEVIGSGRSIEHFDVMEALQSMPELFTKYGGHPMACGFTLKEESLIDDFRQRMGKIATDKLADLDLRKTLQIETELEFEKIDWPLLETLEQFAPFGEGNPEPLFVSRKVTVKEFSCVGKQKDHLRLTVEHGGVTRQCIGFGCGDFADTLKPGSEIDIAYSVSINEWNGNREIQLEIKDIHLQS